MAVSDDSVKRATGKTVLSVTRERLADHAAVARWKQYWKARLQKVQPHAGRIDTSCVIRDIGDRISTC
jgi:hypothetical protein